MINTIIHTLLSKDICVGLTLKDNKIAYEIEGFYKSGNVLLYEDEPAQWVVLGRYHELREVDDIEDLIAFNNYWRDCFRGELSKSGGWYELLVEYQYIRED